MTQVATTHTPSTLMLKLVGEMCDIDCHYCYEKRKPYPGGQVVRPSEVDVLLTHLDASQLSVVLHGGEPLLYGMERMRDLLRVLRRHKVGHVGIQTNGVKLDGRWFDFFDTEWPNLSIGVSLDGDAAGNSYRVDYAGRSTHQQVEQSLRLAQSRGRDLGVIVVVTSASISRGAEILDYFSGFGCVREVRFAPAFDFNVHEQPVARRQKKLIARLGSEDEGVPSWGITPGQFTEFLQETYSHWKDRGYFKRFVIEPHISFIRAIAGGAVDYACNGFTKCEARLTLYPGGVVGGCDNVRGCLGSGPTVYDGAALRAYLKDGLSPPDGLGVLLSKCQQCSYQQTCRRGCNNARLSFQNSQMDANYCAHRISTIDYFRQETSATNLPSDQNMLTEKTTA